MIGDLGTGTGHTHTEGVNSDTGVPNAEIAATKYFKKIGMGHETTCAIQVNFNQLTTTATLAGTIKVQGSNHQNPTDEAAGTNEWIDLDVVFPAAVTSGAGTTGVSMSFIGWRWIRFVFTRTSGTGSLIVRTVIKR